MAIQMFLIEFSTLHGAVSARHLVLSISVKIYMQVIVFEFVRFPVDVCSDIVV